MRKTILILFSQAWLRAVETGEFFTVHFKDRNVKDSDDLAFPEVVAAKIVKFLFVHRRKRSI